MSKQVGRRMARRAAVCLLLLTGMALPAVAQHFDDDESGSFGKTATSSSSSGKENQYKTRIREVTVDPVLGEKTPVEPDTVPLNYPTMAMPEQLDVLAASYLANSGSPFQSMIYVDRKPEERFIFMHPYDHWKSSDGEWHFTNTTRPWTNATYRTTILNTTSAEEFFRFFLTANFNKRLNFALDYESTNGRGYYTNLGTRDKAAHFSLNYQSERYEAFFRGTWSRFENKENGGISNDEYITDPMKMSGGYSEVESLNIPVRLDDTYNLTIYRDLFLNHKYHFGYERIDTTETGDSLKTFVPVASIIHTFQLDNGKRNYDSQTANLSYYDSVANYSGSTTRDTCALTTIRNTLGFAMQEGFRPWVKFGLTAYLEHEYMKYTTISDTPVQPDETTVVWRRLDRHVENLLWAGGRIVSTGDSVFQFHADARFCLLGRIGNLDIDGGIRSRFHLWKKEVNVHAEAFFKNETPDWLYRHYYSNHLAWDNDFSTQTRLRISGGLNLPDWGTDLSVGVENIGNYVYFGDDAKPVQYDGSIQLLYGIWRQKLGVGILHFDFDLAGQLSGDQSALPLPAFSAYGNLYVKTYLSKVLLTQVGVDCRYFTKYNAPAYNPALGMYHTQSEMEIGNYPYMNVYANFHLKRARFYIMYAHLSRLFADPQYFQAPHYPRNPASIMMGLSWNFYD